MNSGKQCCLGAGSVATMRADYATEDRKGMWNLPTYVDDLFGLSTGRRDLLDRVLSVCDAPECGLVVVVEGEDLSEYPNRS